MCNHRAIGRWNTVWSRWAATALGSFTVLEVYGLITEGPEATLSYYLRRRAGLLEPCRHSRLGRLLILAFCSWLWAHLSFGKFGFAPPRRPPGRHNHGGLS